MEAETITDSERLFLIEQRLTAMEAIMADAAAKLTEALASVASSPLMKLMGKR